MRKAIYAKNNPEYRIISVANGLWQVQELQPVVGTRTLDPWMKLGPNKSEAEALAALGRFYRR